MAQASAAGPPFWSRVLRALREARGITREGWAARLGYGRSTVQRWETGAAVPDATAEEVILRVCADLGLFRSFDRGVLQGHTVTPEWLRALLAEARLDAAASSAPDLPPGAAEAPPGDYIPAPAAAPRTNLPAPLTSFIGREPELEVGGRLLATARLVTLTGPGGSGKTRLALELAARALPGFADGAWFVDLSGVTDPALVPAAIAHVLGVQETRTPVLEAVKGFLRDRALLLVLDNFEQVSAAAPTVVELLQAAPRVKVLVTSRAALRVRGEHELPVPPLPVPDPRRLPPVPALAEYAGTALFLDRARAVRPDFALTPDNARAVAEICARLDGLPLAIELAAVHVRILSPRLLAARLERRLPALTGGMRDLPTRHRTLADTIAWSYDLLSAEEQRVFRRLGAFAGGWTLEAAEAVCTDDALEGVRLVEALNALAASSLIIVEHEDPPRFRMLQTIREYAQERLAESGEAAAVFRRHRDWFLRLAEQPPPQPGTEQRAWLERLEREHDNFRTALTWCLAEGDVAAGLRLAAALGRFWYEHGHVAEGLEWLERLLAADGDVPATVRARALAQAGWLAWEQGAFERAGARLMESLELYRRLHDLHGTADTLVLLGRYLQVCADWDGALARLEEALGLYQELGDPLGVAEAVGRMGFTLYAKGEWERAAALCEESIALRRRHGDQFGTFDALCVLARIVSRRQESARAVELYEQALALARAADNERWLADVLVEAGIQLSRTGAHQRALAYQQQSLTLYHRRGTRAGVVYALDAIAGTLVVMGQAERAVRLFAAAETLREAIGLPRPPAFRGIYQRVTELARRTLGEESFAAAWAAGQALPLDEAITEALRGP